MSEKTQTRRMGKGAGPTSPPSREHLDAALAYAIENLKVGALRRYLSEEYRPMLKNALEAKPASSAKRAGLRIRCRSKGRPTIRRSRQSREPSRGEEARPSSSSTKWPADLSFGSRKRRAG